MRRSDAMGLERPAVNGGAVFPRNMSFPDSIRLEPIRLPRATILREDTPIFDISSHQQMDNPTYLRDHFRAPYAATYSPHSFPDQLRSRHMGSPIENSSQQSPVNVTYAGRLVTDRVPRPVARPPIQQDLYLASQPIRATPPIPRITPTPNHVPYPVATVTGTTATVTDMVPSSQSTDKQTIRARALSRNQFLGYQRLTFIMAKYPALVMAIVALWNITGRGKGMEKSSTEECLLYHFVMLVAFCTAAVCVVFSAINLHKFKAKKNLATTCKYKHSSGCYNNQDRLAYLATLMGCGGAIALFALVTFVYGAIGLRLMKKRLAEEYKKEAAQRTYENQAFQY
ncbi:hypothetical protein OSTOST_04818 [Ostertagia ostertagi]